jgi:hypothetical protein
VLRVAWLSIRHRGFTTITAANPGIPHGGFVGESKLQILSNLHSSHVISTALIDAVDREQRLPQLDRAMEDKRMRYPVVLKPDVGQRGAGVKVARSREEAGRYLVSAAGDMLVQPYHEGPFEAGIFYYRIPGQVHGHIFSITDKVFSSVHGDGCSTLRQLIWRHPRHRMQAGTFLQRHRGQLDRVLATGETFPLALAGNHCQGTLFRDGSQLITSPLEAKIDRIARSFPGFYFGRFDVRYSDLEKFKAGQDLVIIELNGITSESTNIYDPARSLPWAYRMLFRQWSLLFEIGAANRRLGHRSSGIVELLRDAVRHYRSPRFATLSD